MQDRWFKTGLLMICLGLGLGLNAPAVATTYDIYPDSTCTLTDAVNAISTLSEQGSCPAGSGGDVINLSSCQVDNTKALEHNLQYCIDPDTKLALDPQLAAVYPITSELVVGGVQKTVNSQLTDINSSITIQLKRDVFDKNPYPNAIIRVVAAGSPPTACTQRAFFVRSKNALLLKNITVDASTCDVSAQVENPNPAPVTSPALPIAPTSKNGGVIYSQGALTLKDGSLVTGGTAANGGGIYLDATPPTLGATLTMENTRINDNTATTNGGGIGMAPTGTLVISGSQFNIFGNSAANGGGIYLDGSKTILGLSSGTFYQNSASVEGAAMDVQAGHAAGSQRGSLLNNVTLMGNTGSVALHYADLCQHETSGTCDLYAPPGAATDSNDVVNTWVADPAKRVDLLYNTVMVGNAGGCAMTFDGSNTTYTFNQYLENAYSVTATSSGCPVAEQSLLPGNATSLPTTLADPANNATVGVLTGGDSGNPAQAAASPCASAACLPMDFGKNLYYLQGFMPTSFDINAPVYPTLVNAASPDTATTNWLCSAKDMRGQSRGDRCDVGAVEMKIATGATDSINDVITAQTTWIDVVKNDLGDESIDCTKIATDCLIFTLQPSVGGSARVVYAAAPLADKTDGTPVYMTTTDPGVQAAADPTHTYPLVQYVSAPGFHGQDAFIYEIPLDVLSGATYAGVEPGAQVNLTVAPKDDFPSKDIKDFKSGGIGVWMLCVLALLGSLRQRLRHKKERQLRQTRLRGWSRLFMGALLTLSATMAQADITVNSLADPTDLTAAANDGQCTLREALLRSFEYPTVANRDCAAGAPGSDTIVLPEGTITLTAPLTISVGNAVVLQGQGVDKTIIDGANQFAINTSSALTLKYLTFQHGRAAQGGAIFTKSDLGLDHVALLDNTATTSGGAVYLSYGTDEKHSLGIDSSYMARNQAPVGGAIFTVGQNQQLALSITNSTFDSNAATTSGGAIAANLAAGGSLDVVNSIFNKNAAPIGAAIDLSNANASTNVGLLNNTFYDNTGGDFLDSGNNINVTLSNSIVASSAANVGCASGTGKLKGDYFNLFTPTEPASCGAGADNMTASFADVTTALNNGALSGLPIGTGSTTDYLPPLFELVAQPPLDPLATDPTLPNRIILDRGNPAATSSGTFSPSVCRTVDMRGKSRQAGIRYGTETTGRCDLGAFEVQIMTALDGTTRTLTSRNDGVALTERQARADVLGNDLPSDGGEIDKAKVGFRKTSAQFTAPVDGTSVAVQDLAAGNFIYGAISLPLPAVTPTGIHGLLQWVKIAQGDPVCAPGDDCGLLFAQSCDDLAQSLSSPFASCAAMQAAIQTALDSTHPLDVTAAMAQFKTAHDTAGLVCPDSSTPAVKIPYVAFDSNGNIATAFVSVTLSDVPPQFGKAVINVYTKPDEPVTFALPVSDPDGVIASVSIPDNGDPLFAEEDPVLAQQKHDTGDKTIHPSWGVGVKWNGNTTNPMITYIRGNKTQVFNDSFQLQVKDNCGSVSAVTVKVNFPQTEAAGGDLLNGGSLGWGLALLLCLGLVRRRRLS